jgi:hypothetical protein
MRAMRRAMAISRWVSTMFIISTSIGAGIFRKRQKKIKRQTEATKDEA